MVFSTGLMEESTMESGKMESNMARELIHLHQERLDRENGLKEREQDGSDLIDEVKIIVMMMIDIKFNFSLNIHKQTYLTF